MAGDTLSKIARSACQDPNLWPHIYGYSDNAPAIGRDPRLLDIGITLNLPPCPRTAKSAAVTPIVNDRRQRSADTIELLTAGNYAPFTDQTWQNGGMLTEIVDDDTAEDGESFAFFVSGDRVAVTIQRRRVEVRIADDDG
ncbi:MAG: hypothetical protein R3F54_12510 [Alphaproteobacteria bacterium]